MPAEQILLRHDDGRWYRAPLIGQHRTPDGWRVGVRYTVAVRMIRRIGPEALCSSRPGRDGGAAYPLAGVVRPVQQKAEAGGHGHRPGYHGCTWDAFRVPAL
jgi:hypothetical protein